jgi:hypothetical protein
MKSAAKEVMGKAFTTPSNDEGGGAREAPSASGPSGQYEERSGPKVGGSKGWTGGYTDNFWMGNPANIKDRQWADAGSQGYHDEVNMAYPDNDTEADIYMVPNFQGQSGQGANQSTLRPIGSV